MTSINTIARIAGIALAVFAMLAVGIALAPSAHAADLSLDTGYSYDYFVPDAPSYGGGSSYDYFVPDYGGGSSYDYFVPDTYGSGFSFGCGGGCGGGFGGGFSYGGMGFGGGYSSSAASSNTSIYAPTNTNTCTAPNSCNTSYDDHSIFNAPTTVTVSGGGSGGSYPVYVPMYQPQYPVYNPPVVYQNPIRQPYVSLNQVPYTGLDLGPVGTVVYWSFLAAWCLLAAYLIVYKRVQTKLVSGLNSFLFGAPATVGTHAKVVMPAKASVITTSAPAAQNDDAIDPFIASQISRNK